MTGCNDVPSGNGLNSNVGIDLPPQPDFGAISRTPNKPSFGLIEAEGAEARWKSAKETARAVFRNPVLVTPRRMALLGEEGLAAFVDEIRSMAQAFILRERQKHIVSSPSTSNATNEKRISVPHPTTKTLRAPAPFEIGKARLPSAYERYMQRFRLNETSVQFISDALFGSAVAAAVIGIAILICRLELTSIH